MLVFNAPYPTASSTVVPPTIASLVAWYDASTVSGSNGSAQSTWADSSGNGHTANEATVGSSPTLVTGAINGLNVIQFSNTNFYNIGNTLLVGGTAGSWAAVFVNDNDPRSGGDIGALIGGFSTDGQPSLHPYIDQTIYDGFCSNSRKTVGNPTPSLTSPRFVVVRSASSDYTWHLDGTSLFSTASNTVGIPAGGTNARSIGGTVGGAGDQARIAEMCIFSTALTTTERQQMEGYLAWKWGLQANLPSGHPYKSVAP